MVPSIRTGSTKVRAKNRNRIWHVIVFLVGICLIGAGLFVQFSSIRTGCVRLADRIGASDVLVEFLDDDDPKVRNTAYTILVNRGAKSVSALMNGLQSNSPRVRKLSAAILGWIDPPVKESLAALRSRMRSDSDEATRFICAQSVGRIGKDDPEVLAECLGLLGHGDEDERLIAVQVLSTLNRSHPSLKHALEDDSAKVKTATARILGAGDD
jgi:HEAT repeat protein